MALDRGLEVVGVTVRFGGMTALTNVSMSARAGAITGLIGPNGAGKTTLFNVITGLQRPSAGSVVVSGTDVTSMAPYRRARLGLTRTFQRLELFGSLTVHENITVAASRHREPAIEATRIIEQLGLTAVSERRADELPTGTGRLVELGRCMATAPSVLLLDEPASGQNSLETATFASVLEELASDGMTIVLVEHDIDLVGRSCSDVVVLDMGSVLATGPLDQLRTDRAVQDAYLGNEVTA